MTDFALPKPRIRGHDRMSPDVRREAPAVAGWREVREVSVVIPTFRRPHLLRRCLAAVCAQNFDPPSFEVIVCDDANDADTRALVEEVAAQQSRRGLDVRYL